MTVNALYAALDARIPEALRAAWDNDGKLCVPQGERELTKVLFCLDVTDGVVARAKETGAELIISHHPLIFSPLSSLTEEGAVASRVLSLVKAGVAVFSFHTRFDAVAGGINDGLCDLLSLSDATPFGEGGLGRVGTLPETMTAKALCALVKEALGAPALSVADAGKPIRRVAVVGGEGKDEIGAAIAAGADAYLSGRLGYHAMQDCPITLIEAGHYYTERHAGKLLADLVKEICPALGCESYTPNPIALY